MEHISLFPIGQIKKEFDLDFITLNLDIYDIKIAKVYFDSEKSELTLS